jgi:hypothetical protein
VRALNRGTVSGVSDVDVSTQLTSGGLKPFVTEVFIRC